MFRGGRGGRRVLRADRVAGLALAIVVGALVPVAVVVALATHDGLPRDCRSGPPTSTTVEGALVYSTGQDLWYSESYPGKPRKLIDYAAAPATRPTPSASAPAPPPPGPSGAAPSPGPPSPVPSTAAGAPSRVLAADISKDRKLVAFIVVDAPDRTGAISVFLLTTTDPVGTPPALAWSAAFDRGSVRLPSIRILDNGRVLFSAPVLAGGLPAPSPAPAPAPSTSPSASPSAGVAVAVVAASPTLTISAQAPEDYFLTEGHSAWPDTRGYHVPPALPLLNGRVDGSGGRVAGREEKQFSSPLGRRPLNQVVLGHAAQTTTQPLCLAATGVLPTGFSPDEAELVLYDGVDSLLLDLSGSHASTRLLHGRLLAWR